MFEALVTVQNWAGPVNDTLCRKDTESSRSLLLLTVRMSDFTVLHTCYMEFSVVLSIAGLLLIRTTSRLTAKFHQYFN